MAGVYEVYVQTHFSAAHCLKGYPGDCARTHGHNWMIDVYVQCRQLDGIGIGIDFRDIETAVREVIQGLDHFDLNELPAFKEVNPTSENIAKYLYHHVAERIDLSVHSVEVAEVDDYSVVYSA